MLNLFADLQRESSLTYVFISHDLRVVAHASDRVAVMYAGGWPSSTRPRALMKAPLHPYTQALLSAEPEPVPARLRNRQRIILKGEIRARSYPPSGCRFHTCCPIAVAECAQREPERREIQPSRFVACHFAGKPMAAERTRRRRTEPQKYYTREPAKIGAAKGGRNDERNTKCRSTADYLVKGIAAAGGSTAAAAPIVRAVRAPRKRGTLLAGDAYNPAAVDPMTGRNLTDFDVLYAVFDALIDYRAEFAGAEARPRQGRGCFTDPTTLVLDLVDGVQIPRWFAVFNAEAVKFNIERYMHRPGAPT